MADCNIQTLLDTAACFACLPPGMQQALELQLLCEIINMSGPTANQEIFVGHYGNLAPPFVPPLNRGVASDLDPPFKNSVWNPDTQAWT